MKGRRANWDSHWQEVTEHVFPRKRNVFEGRHQTTGEKRNNKIYPLNNTTIKIII